MDLAYEYTRKRSEFGRHPNFADTPVETICDIPPTDELQDKWLPRKLTTVTLDCIPSVSEHYVNTERFIQDDKGMQHTEGGWPKDVDTTEFTEKQRFLRKIENDPSFNATLMTLARRVEECVMQNNSIDVYEEYFEGMTEDHSSEPPSARTVTVFRDPNEMKRAAVKIAWHPDNATRMCISYSVLQFQQMSEAMPLDSYIWDVNNPNAPTMALKPNSPMCCCAYNPKSTEQLLGGCYNGVVALWDVRRGEQPIDRTSIEVSHNDPVYDVSWIQSRTGSEFVSVSTDGLINWWDCRKLGSGPIDSMNLQSAEDAADGEPIEKFGGTVLCYRTDAGATRFLVGTEQGTMLTIERKAKKDQESQKSIKALYGVESGRHHGQVYSVERNQFFPKAILTVGDWAARIWMEDLRTPVMSTRYQNTYLTAGCWSPTRPGVFFLTKDDGTLDIWDYYYKQAEPVYPVKIGEQSLSSIAVQKNGRLVAVGAKDGSTTILEICKSLAEPSKQEREAMGQMFERELSREKNLAQRRQQLARAAKHKNKEVANPQDDEKEPQASAEDLAAVEKRFFELVEKNKPLTVAEEKAALKAGGGEDDEKAADPSDADEKAPDVAAES